MLCSRAHLAAPAALPALLLAVALGSTASAKGLDCGPPTPASAATLPPATTLQDLDDPTRLADAVAQLRAAGLGDLQLVDHLVLAYCRDAASRPQSTRSELVEQVRAFAARVTPLVYGSDDEAAIIVDLPLAPAMLAAVDNAAQREGLTRIAWIRKALEGDLPRP